MRSFNSRPVSYCFSFLACIVLVMTSGCASGGFKLTRQYAGWVNSQSTILRVVLYILTGVVFAITLLIDLVINNTMDFWNGRVAAGNYLFQGNGKNFYVQHEISPNSKLRKSTIRITDTSEKQLQELILQETPAGEIELYVDGKIRTRVNKISELPIVSFYNDQGKFIRRATLETLGLNSL